MNVSPRLAISVALAAAMIAVALGTNRGMAEAAPDPSGAYIHSITYSGSGCPAGTVGQSLSNDRLSFTLIFDQFVAFHASGVSSSEWVKDCSLTLSLFVPSGTADVSLQVDARGYSAPNPYHSAFSRLSTDGGVDSLRMFEGGRAGLPAHGDRQPFEQHLRGPVRNGDRERPRLPWWGDVHLNAQQPDHDRFNRWPPHQHGGAV